MILSPETTERLMQEFINRLMASPGCYLQPPVPISYRANFKEDPTISGLIQDEICRRTEQMLNIMGITYHRTKVFIKVEELLDGK
jgi:hypothetical protein